MRTLAAILLITSCSYFQPVDEPDWGDVDLAQEHYFWPSKLRFELKPWEEITSECRPYNPSRRRYNGCIFPSIFSTRKIAVMDTWEWTMLEIAQHECEHYAYGSKHTGVDLIRSGNVAYYRARKTEPNPNDPQAKVKAEAVLSCMAQFREFLEER
jgi:hypothetical protein